MCKMRPLLSGDGISPNNLTMPVALQRHFSASTKFAPVESRLSGCKRQREVVSYARVNLCDRRACSASVAVGVEGQSLCPWERGSLEETRLCACADLENGEEIGSFSARVDTR